MDADSCVGSADRQSRQRRRRFPESPRRGMVDLVMTAEIAMFDTTPMIVTSLFAEWAQRAPAALAVASANSELSYGQLETRANQLAHRLRSEGVTGGTVVGLFLTRSVSLAVAALGVLKAGGAYLPLDPAIPAE